MTEPLPALHEAVRRAEAWSDLPKAREELVRVEAALQAAREVLEATRGVATVRAGAARQRMREALKELGL